MAVRFKGTGLETFSDDVRVLPQNFPYLRYASCGSVPSRMALQAVFAKYDLLVTPTVASMPVKNRGDGNTIGPTQVNGEEVDPLIGWCLTYPINFTGHPAASIPAGMVGGLPVGMQIIGRRYADADVLAASAVFEQLRPWADTYRICAERTL
jgi:amidase